MSNPPPPRNFRLVISIMIVLLILGLVAIPLVLRRAQSYAGYQAQKVQAKTAAAGVVNAVKAYFTEYQKWPRIPGDGLFLDEPGNARLMLVLKADDFSNNPRGIRFFENRPATRTSGPGSAYGFGLSPETGAMLDPWGHPFRIAIDTDGDGKIASPYPGEDPIKAEVIVWSLGKGGQQDATSTPKKPSPSDDIKSW